LAKFRKFEYFFVRRISVRAPSRLARMVRHDVRSKRAEPFGQPLSRCRAPGASHFSWEIQILAKFWPCGGFGCVNGSLPIRNPVRSGFPNPKESSRTVHTSPNGPGRIFRGKSKFWPNFGRGAPAATGSLRGQRQPPRQRERRPRTQRPPPSHEKGGNEKNGPSGIRSAHAGLKRGAKDQ